MLFNTILIAASFFVWYISDNLAFYFGTKGSMNESDGLVLEASVRLFRILCQQLAFSWILISFSKYGRNVDKKIEKHKIRQSIKKLRPGPEIFVDRMDDSIMTQSKDLLKNASSQELQNNNSPLKSQNGGEPSGNIHGE